MEKISPQEFQQLVDGSKVLEKDGFGPKVLLTEDGLIVKIFRRKRLLSGALIFSYARRFAYNAKRLKRLGIPTVTVLRLAACPEPQRQLVWYQPLPGETLRDCCRKGAAEDLMKRLGGFVASLHERGVLFRSLHWGNIIVGEDNSFGLIDVADLKIQRWPLSFKQRERNFSHMLRYDKDRQVLVEFSAEFWGGYHAKAAWPEKAFLQLQKTVNPVGRS